jgi:hypothetical protein
MPSNGRLHGHLAPVPCGRGFRFLMARLEIDMVY